MKPSKYYKIRIEDPDGFLDKLTNDEEGNDVIHLQEGELPPRPPKYYFVETDEAF